MAHSVEKWKAVRRDREIHSLSFEKLSKKHNIAKSNILKKAKKEVWIKGKTDQIVKEKVLIKQQQKALDVKTGMLESKERTEIDKLVYSELALQQLMSTAKGDLATKIIDKTAIIKVDEDNASDNIVKMSTAIKNLDAKPDTQVNVQNNSQPAEPTTFKFLPVSNNSG